MRYLPPATAIAGEGRYLGEPGAEEGTAAALNMEDILYVLRKRRNDAVHAGLDSRHNSIAVPGTNISASSCYPAELVKSKLLKLEYAHVEYVIACMKRTTTRIWNIKKYLLAALFNAPSTIGGYYQAEVNHDMR